jgi:hypothetical protein
VHVPKKQSAVGAHARPQRPQLVLLVRGLMQSVPQLSKLTGQVHDPSRHCVPLKHVSPHPPQLASSEWGSTHSPLHWRRPMAVQFRKNVEEVVAVTGRPVATDTTALAWTTTK